MKDAITNHPFAESFWPEHIETLVSMASEIRFRPGEFIFHERDYSSFFYLIVSGNVALEVLTPGHPVRVDTVYAGEVLGWSSLTGESDGKQFQARALEEVHAIAFDGARLRHACEADYAFGFRCMRAIAKVMSHRLRSVRTRLLNSYSPVGV
jgi:CRP-like cAMP-binding protein